jgi:hypothetical protein
MLKTSWNTFVANDSTNGVKPTSVLKIQKPLSNVRKLSESNMDRSKLYGDYMTNFIGWMKSPNVANSACKRKKVRTTSKTRPIIKTNMCVCVCVCLWNMGGHHYKTNLTRVMIISQMI